MEQRVEQQVRVIKPDQRSENTAQTSGMVRQAGIAPDLVNSRGLWVGFVSTPPALASGAHHHGDAESALYVLRGRVRFYFGPDLGESLVAEAGDFIFVPPNTVHVEENLSTDEPVEFIVSRNSTEMLVVNVPDPREGQ